MLIGIIVIEPMISAEIRFNEFMKEDSSLKERVYLVIDSDKELSMPGGFVNAKILFKLTIWWRKDDLVFESK